jgi:hypothetical protein
MYRPVARQPDRETNETSAATQQILNMQKYMQPLVSNAFANTHVLTAMNPHATTKGTAGNGVFCAVRDEMLYAKQLEQ